MTKDESKKAKNPRKLKPKRAQVPSKPFDGHPMDWVIMLARDPNRRSAGVRVALGIAAHVNRKRGEAWPSMDAVSQLIGVKKRGVELYVAELETDGWLRKVRRGKRQSNIYVLTVPDGDPQRVADHDAFGDPQPAADHETDDDPQSSADHLDSGDPQRGAERSAMQCMGDPQPTAVPIEEPVIEPVKEPGKSPTEGGAAHQAPASADPSPPSSTGPVLRAAGAASDGPLPRCPANTCTASGFLSPNATELLDLIDAAEEFRKTNPELTRREYSPPRLTEAEALAVYRSSPRSARLREDAEGILDLAGLDGGVAPEDTPAIVELVRMLHDDPPMDAVPDLAAEVRERAIRARRITLHKAAQVAVAEKVSGFVVVEDDEVPF